ncbi:MULTISPECIES: hypothetical protein [Parabacteroides]|uniref:hypothetical protein n=1 Tax=Parabacteroides TaxID=375288 RepID=UPI000EFF165D|nr:MULTISPECIES: hypothetical protein [Parabacteroides]RHU30586.1 hypothetical protein DXD68_01835 [Parabacteroides sp. TM07-1AC]WFE83919.1 hypothetical protein P3L47_17515 [Parabacteroides chongii]
MKIKGVITGDIIQSTHIDPANRSLLLDTINNIVHDTEKWGSIRLDIYRGDSFQIIINNPVKALRTVLLLRIGLQAKSPTSFRWDARMALGIGTIDFEKEESVIESDGEAFRFSGWEFDKLGRSKNLALKTPWDEFNDEFKVSTAFVDDIASNWTITQSQALYLSLLTGKTQKEIADDLQKSSQAISKLLIGGKANLIELYLNRYEQLISTKNL